MDGLEGYLALNFISDVYPGWHGGPSDAESFVPLLFGMPGDSFVDSDAPSELRNGFDSGTGAIIQQDGYLRNWQFSPILSRIVNEFRDESDLRPINDAN